MKRTSTLQSLAALLILIAATAHAEFVTVDLKPFVNSPVGLLPDNPQRQTLAEVPFDILPSTGNNVWNASVGTRPGVRSIQTLVVPMQIEGATAVDTLINTSWAAADSSTIPVTCVCTDGRSFKKLLKTGSDVRDWNDGPFGNKTNGTTTVGTRASKKGYVDKQHIELPKDFADRTLAYIIVMDSGVTGNDDVPASQKMQAQRAFVTAITVTTASE